MNLTDGTVFQLLLRLPFARPNLTDVCFIIVAIWTILFTFFFHLVIFFIGRRVNPFFAVINILFGNFLLVIVSGGS